jgi:hypothetical protein
MNSRPWGARMAWLGFPPSVPSRRACFADAWNGLIKLSGGGKKQPSKIAPHPRAGPREPLLRPSRNRVHTLGHRLATAALGGVGLVLFWQVADRRSLLRVFLASVRRHLYQGWRRPGELRASLLSVVRPRLRRIRR